MTVRAARKPLVAGNWKMHNNHFEAIALTQKLAFTLVDKDFTAADIAVLPPFTALRSVQTLIEGDKLQLLWGAQDVSAQEDGPYTGDVSARMLAKLGCRFVLAGHSERRQYHHEDDALINAKVRRILEREMTPVLCIGESLAVRQAGGHLELVLGQLDGGLDGLTAEQVGGLVVAYEPVWAIGTGLTPTAADVEQIHHFIREFLVGRFSGDGAAMRILYGGSVKPANARELLAVPNVNGALIGGASLKAVDFLAIAADCP